MQLEDKNEADVEDFEASIYILHMGRLDMYLECVVVKLVLNKMTQFFPREKCISFTKYCTFKKPTSRTSCTQPIKK